ncbi:MFS transporter [Rhizobium mongolense]|uniref:Transmembrane secretion effector n=2 Tax=Rhizobium mongolense TaxID=57676 RepID=A0ABR6IX93_9HYPH|nr:hypothetical protein [Rhizobium mongolense]TVZ75043.1 transmembrane secretion effector [Rhizobium mongolense USDA 1844]
MKRKLIAVSEAELSWLMATVSTSDLMVALVQASSTLPAFFLAVFVGAIAHNYSRRMVMIVGRSLMMAASAMLTIIMAFGITDPWVILAFSFLDGYYRSQRSRLASVHWRYPLVKTRKPEPSTSLRSQHGNCRLLRAYHRGFAPLMHLHKALPAGASLPPFFPLRKRALP